MSDPDPSLHSILRVNPVGFIVDDIDLNTDVKEISLHNGSHSKKSKNVYETWIYEEVLDKPEDIEDGLKFSSQDDAYEGFEKWYESNIDPAKGSDSLTCMAIGGRGSGKSYTLFGQDTRSDKGIIPRFLSSRFDFDNGHQDVVSFMLINMYMVNGDTMYDLLNPPEEKSLRSFNFTYSDSLGVIPLPMKCLRAESAAHGLQILHLGLMTASMIALSSNFIFNGLDIVVSMRMFQPEKVISMTFVEISTMLYLPSSLADSDRYSSQVHDLRSSNAFADCGLFGSTAGLSDNKKKLAKAQKAINSSFLSYLLQDSLVLGGSFLYPTNLSACLVIGCLRGDRQSFSENKFTLNLIQTLTDRFQSIVDDRRFGDGPDDLNSIGRDRSLTSGGSDRRGSKSGDRPGSKSGGERPGSRNSRFGLGSAGAMTRGRSASTGDDSVAVVPHKSMTMDSLITKLELELLSLDVTRQSDLQIIKVNSMMNDNNPNSDDNSKMERRLEFYDRKQKYIELIIKHMKSYVFTKKMKRHDIKVIAYWLKDRGLYGLKVNKDNTKENLDHKLRDHSFKRHEGEEVEISNMPWVADGLPTDPYLVPITSLNFSSSYLIFPIPPGHMAFCKGFLNTYYRDDAAIPQRKPLSFPGSKNVKILQLDNILINNKHCMLFRVGSTIKIRPLVDDDHNGMAFVEVNGVTIVEETVLKDLDVIRMGSSVVFVVHIPMDSDDEEENERGQDIRFKNERPTSLKALRSISSRVLDMVHIDSKDDSASFLPLALAGGVASGHWDNCIFEAHKSLIYAVIKDYLEHSNIVRHVEVDRAIAKITPTKSMNEAQKMTVYVPRRQEVLKTIDKLSGFHKALLAESIAAVNCINFMAKEMKKSVFYSVHLRPRPQQTQSSFIARQYRGSELGVRIDDNYFDITANAEVLDGGVSTGRGDSWWWSVTILMQRLSLIRPMYRDFVWKFDRETTQLDDEYPPAKDPFLDPSEPELLGVSNIHLDSLFYLMDVRDTVPIVTFKGVSGGLLKFTLRCWIDAVDTIPNYIKVDEECKLTDFMGHKCIMKFYFESLFDINPSLSNDIQIAFNFFTHSGQYRTPRHILRNEKYGDQNPYLNNIVVVEQAITTDFIDFVQKRSIELEIWGGRIFNKRIISKSSEKRKKYVIGDPKVSRSQVSIKWNIYCCCMVLIFSTYACLC